MKGFVIPNGLKINKLTWFSNEAGEVKLERSQAPHEGFEVIGSVNMEDGLHFDNFDVANENRVYYYKVGGHMLDCGGMPNPMAREIVRRDRWFLGSQERHSGSRDTLVLIRRTEGLVCPECWDPVHEKIKKSKCPTCSGTGKKDPYFTPLKIKVARSIKAIMRAPQPDRIGLTIDCQFWTSNYPLMKPGDLLKVEGEIFRNERTQFSRTGSYIVKQTLLVKRIEAHQEEYRIDWGD